MKRPIKTLEGLGRALRDARKGRRWTQAVLAERAGVTQATVSTFERGGGNPTFATVLKLAAAAGLSLAAEFGPGSRGKFPWEHAGSDGLSDESSSCP